MQNTQKTPNPQGKGLVPVLSAFAEVSGNGLYVPPKHVEQISGELFTSLFVLESDFSFKPIRGRVYWLYRYGERFALSLLSPQQWRAATYDQVIGQCELHDDLTWTLELSEDAADDEALMQKIADKRASFERDLQDAETLDAILPVYQQELPFYARVLASALASSLGNSMQQSGIRGLNYEQAKGLLTAPAQSAAHSMECRQ